MRTTMIAVLLLSASATFAETFKDVPKDHWAAESVQIVAADGVMKGYPDATFKGDKPVTRYELAVALERMIFFIEQSLKPEVQRREGVESRTLNPVQGKVESPGAPSPPRQGVQSRKSKVESPGEGAVSNPSTPTALSRPGLGAVSKGDPAQALKAGGFIPANSPLLTDPKRTVSAGELAQALSSVASRLIEKHIPPPKDE